MAENPVKSGFTIYLEGHEGHQGNVLAHAFIAKVHRLILVLNKLERAFEDTPKRKTDFEIVGADKHNPTTLDLKPVPRTPAYNPNPALRWSIDQIQAVGKGEAPDERVRGEIAFDLVKLATKESEYDYRAFWINGHAKAVRFDDDYRENAYRVAKERVRLEAPTRWHVGASLGSVVGDLRKVDALDAENEFVIVPPTGGVIRCVFPDSMKEGIGAFLFKMVKARGVLHYNEESPFPYRVEVRDGGLETYPPREGRRNMVQLRGVFAGAIQDRPNWDALLNGR